MSIRFADPEMSYFLKHQVMNDNWEKTTQIILWSMETGIIKPINDSQTGEFIYECTSKSVENMIRKLLAFGRGSFFNKQPLETQAIMAGVIDPDKASLFPQHNLPPSPPQTKRKKR